MRVVIKFSLKDERQSKILFQEENYTFEGFILVSEQKLQQVCKKISILPFIVRVSVCRYRHSVFGSMDATTQSLLSHLKKQFW